MILEDRYLIKKNKNNTLLISKNNSNNIYKFDGVSKIIIDNYSKGKDEVINIIYKKYKIDKTIIEKDYYEFINELSKLDNSVLVTETITESEFEKLFNEKTLKSCTIEITNACPCKCDHCYVKKNVIHHMNYDTFKKIIDELIRIKCFNILITGGEPLSNPKFIEMYTYAKEKGFIVGLNTNALLINKKIIELFSKYKPSNIEISLYGYNNETYELFTHYKKAFDKVNNNILSLINNDINVLLKSTITKRNKNYLKQLKDFARGLNLKFRYDYIVFPNINEKKFIRNPESLEPKEVIELISKDKEDENYFKTAVKETNLMKNNDNNIDKVFQCSIGKEQIFIDCYGNIKPCLVVNEKYNISNYKIEEALNIINNSLCKLEFTINSKCRNCYKRKLCRYCPGRFYLETGSYEIPPKYYCELSDLMIEKFSEVKLKYELFTYDNKISEDKYESIYRILLENQNIITGKDNSSKEMHDKWVNMILNTQGYNILVCYLNEKIVGFIAFMYLDIGLMLSEVQIKKEYQGTHNIFKNMLKEVLEISDKSKYSKLYCTISSKNLKSQGVFTHIGFKKQEGVLYSIDYLDLLKWINK